MLWNPLGTINNFPADDIPQGIFQRMADYLKGFTFTCPQQKQLMEGSEHNTLNLMPPVSIRKCKPNVKDSLPMQPGLTGLCRIQDARIVLYPITPKAVAIKRQTGRFKSFTPPLHQYLFINTATIEIDPPTDHG